MSELVASLAAGSTRARRDAALEISGLGAAAAEAAPAVARAALHDASPQVREAALQALVAADVRGASVELLLRELDGASTDVRFRILGILTALGSRAQEAALPLAGLLATEDDPAVAAAAADGLGSIDVRGTALPRLQELAGKPGPRRLLALQAIGSYGPAAAPAIATLEAAMAGGTDEDVRRGALLALMALEAAMEPAVPAIAASLEDPALRVFALLALTRLGTRAAAARAAIEPLAADPEVGAQAQHLLALMDGR